MSFADRVRRSISTAREIRDREIELDRLFRAMFESAKEVLLSLFTETASALREIGVEADAHRYNGGLRIKAMGFEIRVDLNGKRAVSWDTWDGSSWEKEGLRPEPLNREYWETCLLRFAAAAAGLSEPVASPPVKLMRFANMTGSHTSLVMPDENL